MIAQFDWHSIYLACDLDHQPVRLKVLSGALAADSRQVSLFQLEAAAAARLSHPNILKTSEAQELNGLHFCVIEERAGTKTLRDHLKLKGWLDADEALRITLQIADALEYAHSLGVLHLTLEPQKILLDESGGLFVTDFGIGRAKDLMWARQARSHRCSARYISPEQILSGDADQRSDLYLLGIILFEMLTDRAPFESDDGAALRLKHLTRTPQPPHMFRQELPAALSAIVMDLLSKRPDGRPFDVAAFKSALQKSEIAAPPVAQECEAAETVEEAPAVWQQAIEEDRSSQHAAVTADIDEEPPERDYLDRPSVSIDAIEEPLEETEAYRPVEPVAAAPVFTSGEVSGNRSHRLIWPVILLLLGGGLLWAFRDARFQSEAVESAATSAVAEPGGKDELPASEAEAVAPATEIEAPVEHRVAREEGVTVTARDEGETVAARESESDEKAALLPPASLPPASAGPKTAPPQLSAIEPVLAPEFRPPAELNRGALDFAAPASPPPVPDRPVKAEPSGPRIIRKSGDVLQNTALVRARPVYPKEAREAGVKGAVTVEVTVGEDGSVVAARAISGPEQLRASALAAARRWKWMPARVGRDRARVVGTITLRFEE
ncbi:MAG TPA: TonB family protein [Blastocatellia bacterium]|nr:TonB family protein [Blastocatellia bacterium]